MNRSPRSGFPRKVVSVLFLPLLAASSYSTSNKITLVARADNSNASGNAPAGREDGSATASVDDRSTISNIPGGDSVNTRPSTASVTPSPVPGHWESTHSSFESFSATAYCLHGRTSTGMSTRKGLIAADPRVLPMGSIVHIEAGSYSGTYLVLDTGGRIRGKVIDIYLPDAVQARQFGRRSIKLKVIGHAAPSGLRPAGNAQ
ncbi:MAG TPA: 3D domain-containing protein [Blastocatellia bacterium]|nr:3D domain-containing protein [Blastocatellia bacterium]